MKRKKKDDIKSAIYGCILGTAVGLSLIGLASIDKKEVRLGKAISIADILDDDYTFEQSDELYMKINKLKYSRECALALEKYEEKKINVLNSFKKCDTLDDVLKRQEELENLNLTDEDKIYKDCPMPAELQHFVYEQSIMNNKPFDFMMSIIYAETRGMFNSSGKASYNSDSGTYDLGYTQQNSAASLPMFASKYNVSYDQAWNLVQYNDYINVCAAFLVVSEINKMHTEYDAYEYAGCYNGWLGWRNYSISQEYVYTHFSKAYDEVFTDHHYIEDAKYAATSNSNRDVAVLKR